jgi:DNA-binding transcriptional LysR family regulator
MIDLLGTLQAVSRHGTFATAGMRLGITQSAVSMQIKKLEEQLGYAVLDRSGRKAVINDAGRKVIAHAQQIDSLLAQLRQGIADEDLTGLLRIGSISTSLLSDIPDALAHLRIKMPKLELHLTPGTSPELLLAVEEGRLDAALLVRPSHPTEGDLLWQTLRQEPFVLIAPSHASRSLAMHLLASSPFIRYDRSSHGGGLVDRYLKRKRIAVRDHVEVDSIEAIALMVSGGQGVAIVPDTPCLRKLKLEIAYLSLGDDSLYRSIGLVARSDGARLHLVRQFWQAL